MQRDHQLPHVAGTGHSIRRGSHFLDGWKQEGHQQGDNRDDHQ
jgi:hypothetical protein